MMLLLRCILLSAVWIAVLSSPYDDGKYNPKKYRVYDDGKYYRPLDEGKYIPGDEGRYTYVYRQGLYPTDDGDYRYIHQEGPNGGFGGNGGSGGNGGGGSDDQNSADGNTPHKIEYIGRRIYAERYPYIHNVIKALVNEYVSSDILASEGSASHYRKVYADNEVAAKCRYLTPSDDEAEFVTQYPPQLQIQKDEKLGYYYSFKGTKTLSTVVNSLKNKLKLEYEVFVRIVDEVTD